MKPFGFLAFAAATFALGAQEPPPFGPPGQPDRDGPGPWDNDVVVYRLAADGRAEKLAAFERAGVPTLARLDDGRLIAAFQHFPQDDNRNFDRVAVRFSSDEGRTWSKPEPITVRGMESGLARPFDPTLVPLPDGRLRLYFTSNRNPDFRRSAPAIYSAISTNGVLYVFEPGVRFAVEGRVVIDCAAALHEGVFHLIVPDNGNAEEMPADSQRHEPPRGGTGYHAVSQDGLQFKRVADVTLSSGNRWLGNLLSDGGRLCFFGTGGGGWPVTSVDGVTWQLEANPVRLPGADPGAVKLKDGRWLLAVTSPPRPGTASAQRRQGVRPEPRPGDRQTPGDARPIRDFQDAGPPPRFPPQGPPRPARGEIRVEKIDSKYAVAPGARSGRFVTGQEADLMLGGFGFNNAGGPLLFNHPTGLATDGKALLMTDRWNNRVLVWKSAPAGNTPPDLVLGQPNFVENNPGTGRHQMNWPGNVAITPDGKRIAVADTDNDRILIWNSFPGRSGAAADIVLELAKLPTSVTTGPGAPRSPNEGERRLPRRPGGGEPQSSDPPEAGAPPNRGGPGFGAPREKSIRPESEIARPRGGGEMRLGWPWGVWTDGRKFAVVATHGGAVLIWDSLPARDNQPPDLVLRPRDAGTPRNITSDGATLFAVSDHNNGNASRPATMVWRGIPTSSTQAPDFKWNEWVKGSFTPDGGLVVGGMQSAYVWNKAPRDAETDADVVLRPQAYRNGDGPDAVVANGRLYLCTYNGNNLLAWNSLPRRDNQPPDFSVGSARPEQDTWAENFFIQNPVVATDGKSLFVSSDFDRKMFVWRQLPNENAAKPDLVFHLPEGPWDNELHGTTLVLAGKSTVYLWRTLPLTGELPDATLTGSIGNTRLGEITGVAFDDRYFYLSDRRAEAIYVWEGIPTPGGEPKFTLPMRGPGRLNSDGKYLCAAPFEGSTISVWRVDELGSRAEPVLLGSRGQFNLPSECLIADGRLYVANRSFNRVDAWNRVEDALAGRAADSFLGVPDEADRQPGIGRNRLFMPGSLAWGGGYLWVGEFKFSTRILRFSPPAASNPGPD